MGKVATRKTVEVEMLKTYVNERLKLTEAGEKETRIALYLLLEETLHVTGNYRGFRWLEWDEIASGQAGIYYTDNGVSFADTDSTRRCYF
jgi:hypothetical protein